jgi:hypothetical protein
MRSAAEQIASSSADTLARDLSPVLARPGDRLIGLGHDGQR